MLETKKKKRKKNSKSIVYIDSTGKKKYYFFTSPHIVSSSYKIKSSQVQKQNITRGYKQLDDIDN